MIIAVSFVLTAVVIALAAHNINRERSHMTQILDEKGAALIKSFEAGARTGMRGMMSSGRLQTLLEETAAQEDILYLLVTDQQGRILAHNDPQKLYAQFMPHAKIQSLDPQREVKNKILEGEAQRSFLVYSTFSPLKTDPPGQRHRWQFQDSAEHIPAADCPVSEDVALIPENEAQRFIFVGLDPAPFEQARTEDIRNTLLTSGILLIIGLSGVLLLYWIQRARLARQMLQDVQAFSTAVVSSMPLGLLVLDRSEQITYSNLRARELLNLESDPKGQRVDLVLPGALTSFLQRLSKDRDILEQEEELHFSSGQVLPASLSGVRLYTAEGDYAGKLLIIKDLRQIKNLQHKVQRQEKLAAIGHLAAGIAHEIRNPLSSIKGLATYFQGRSPESSPDKAAAQTMVQEVDRLNRVVTELLEFARPSDIQPAYCDVHQLVRHSLGLVQQDAAHRQISIRFEPQAQSLSWPLDQDRLNQALLNMYLNAIQAMESGGQLTVQTWEANTMLHITVSDTGPGIPDHDLEKIFNPYFTSKKTGTGLGLAVVDKIVQAHQGQIKVFSTKGQGSTFHLMLPRGADYEQ